MIIIINVFPETTRVSYPPIEQIRELIVAYQFWENVLLLCIMSMIFFIR